MPAVTAPKPRNQQPLAPAIAFPQALADAGWTDIRPCAGVAASKGKGAFANLLKKQAAQRDALYTAKAKGKFDKKPKHNKGKGKSDSGGKGMAKGKDKNLGKGKLAGKDTKGQYMNLSLQSPEQLQRIANTKAALEAARAEAIANTQKILASRTWQDSETGKLWVCLGQNTAHIKPNTPTYMCVDGMHWVEKKVHAPLHASRFAKSAIKAETPNGAGGANPVDNDITMEIAGTKDIPIVIPGQEVQEDPRLAPAEAPMLMPESVPMDLGVAATIDPYQPPEAERVVVMTSIGMIAKAAEVKTVKTPPNDEVQATGSAFCEPISRMPMVRPVPLTSDQMHEATSIVNNLMGHFNTGSCSADRYAWHITLLLGVVFNQAAAMNSDIQPPTTPASSSAAQ